MARSEIKGVQDRETKSKTDAILMGALVVLGLATLAWWAFIAGALIWLATGISI